MKTEKIALFAALLALCSCGPAEKRERASGVVPVKTLCIEMSQQAGSRSYVGTIEEDCGSQIGFATMGTVAQVLVEEGDMVRAGETVALLDKTTAENSYEIAKSTLSQAQDGFNRLKALYDKGSLPEVKYIEIETQLAQAKAGERIARKALDDCTLHAPFGGYIARRMVDAGNSAAPGIGCFKLVKIDRVKVKIAIPEKEISTFKKGENIPFTVAALEGRSFNGEVSEIGVQANPLSHTYDVRLKLENRNHALLPGMVCSVTRAVSSGEEVVIPQEAVMLDGSHTFVWIAKEGKATKRAVTSEGVNDAGAIITDGLQHGDLVIVSGQNSVSEGTPIKIE